MKSTCTLIKKTDLDILIESGDKNAINEVIRIKERALENASENAEFYRSISNAEFADNEQSRANRLMRDLKKNESGNMINPVAFGLPQYTRL